MPYYTDPRGVKIYHDHNTPPEYATSADEERGSYIEAQTRAYKAAGEIHSLIDKNDLPSAHFDLPQLLDLDKKLDEFTAKAEEIRQSMFKTAAKEPVKTNEAMMKTPVLSGDPKTEAYELRHHTSWIKAEKLCDLLVVGQFEFQ